MHVYMEIEDNAAQLFEDDFWDTATVDHLNRNRDKDDNWEIWESNIII